MDRRLRRESVQGRQIQRKHKKLITFFVLWDAPAINNNQADFPLYLGHR